MTTSQTHPTPARTGRRMSLRDRDTRSGAGRGSSCERRGGASPLALARLAGVLYLIIFACGVFSELLVRGSIVVPDDAAATAQNILAHETLFRVGFASDLVMLLSDVGVAVLFYVLLRPVSRTLALLALSLRLLMDAVLGANLLNHLAAVLILSDSDRLAGFDADQVNSLALLSMDAHKYGYLIGLVFFGLHVAVLGYLFFRSTYFPRLLGVLLGLAAVGYLVDSFGFFLLPSYDGSLSPIALAPVFVAELAVIGWLLVKGLDLRRWNERVGSSSPERDPAHAPA